MANHHLLNLLFQWRKLNTTRLISIESQAEKVVVVVVVVVVVFAFVVAVGVAVVIVGHRNQTLKFAQN